MGLFIKKIIAHNVAYDTGNTSTLLIIGLGNIGKQFDNTRHNIGFACINAFRDTQSEFSPWQDKKALHCKLSSGTLGQTKVLLIKPTTFMNESGRAVRAVMDYYNIPLNKFAVIHDELDLPFGQIKTKIGGGSAGNNGIKSIISCVGDGFGRIRIGINSPKPAYMDSAKYVLSQFNQTETKNLTLLKREVHSLLIEFIYRGKLVPETRTFIV